MLEWLNNNSSAITAVSTTALVVITSIYAYLTSRLASGGDKTNEKLKELAEALSKSVEKQSEVITALKEGQALQDEANLMKYYEIMGDTKINKPGFDKAFPHHCEKRRKYRDPNNS